MRDSARAGVSKDEEVSSNNTDKGRCILSDQAHESEEIATMDFPFEGIPTIPPRKDMDRMAFFCSGCRNRVTAYPDWPVEKVKQALWNGKSAERKLPEGILHRIYRQDL